jgi:hypothetical protein
MMFEPNRIGFEADASGFSERRLVKNANQFELRRKAN